MRNLFFLTLLLFIVSCENSIVSFGEEDTLQEIINDIQTRNMDYEEFVHPLIEGHYVDFVNNQYEVTISKDEAIEIGISADSYDEFLELVSKTNNLIQETIEECVETSDTVIVVSNLYDTPNSYVNLPIAKTRAEPTNTMPSGTIQTNGQEEGMNPMTLPREMKFVICDCYARAAPAAGHVVTTKVFGGTKVGTGIGQHTGIKVGVSASGTVGGIYYKTTDSNGGICAWMGSEN